MRVVLSWIIQFCVVSADRCTIPGLFFRLAAVFICVSVGASLAFAVGVGLPIAFVSEMIRIVGSFALGIGAAVLVVLLMYAATRLLPELGISATLILVSCVAGRFAELSIQSLSSRALWFSTALQCSLAGVVAGGFAYKRWCVQRTVRTFA